MHASICPIKGKARDQGDYSPWSLFRLGVFDQANGLPKHLPLVRQKKISDLFVAPDQGVLYVRSCYHSLDEHTRLPVSVHIAA